MAGMPAMEGMSGMEGMAGMSADAGGSVQLSAGQLREFGVTFATAEMRPLTAGVRTTGTVTVDETRVASVAPKVGGFVERLHVATTGQPVRRGQPMLDLYSPELVAVQEELLVARRLDRTLGESAVPGVPAGSGDLLAAARRRLRLLDVTDAQIDAVLRTGRVRRALTLYAPVSGVVTEKRVVQGQATQPGEPLYTVVDLARVWVDLELRESDAGSVRAGTAAALDFAAYPGREFAGRVTYVYPTLQAESRTVRARVEVANGEGLLKPGMYATARLTTPGRDALTVPASAVIRTGERTVAFVDMGGGKLMPHELETGAAAGDQVEVLAGLEPGQRVVTSAQFLLESESNIGEVMKAMMGQMGSGGSMGGMEGMDMKDTPGMEMPGMGKGADMKGMPGMQPPPAAAAAPGSRGGSRP
jgi:Cu(I)/Ag(I) efflux system membrane fusion protein